MSNKTLEAFFSGKKNGLLLYTACGHKKQSLLFEDPVCTIECRHPAHLVKDMQRAQTLVASGLYAAGFFSYELGYFLEKKLSVNPHPLTAPLFKLMFFKKPSLFKNLNLSSNFNFTLSPPVPSLNLKHYAKGFRKIKTLIKDGEIYQANYCFKLDFTLRGSLKDFFITLSKRQPSAYSAFMRFGNTTIISFSPELFYKNTSTKITMKPMKGTLLKPASKYKVERFKKDSKTLAENLMIVDLIRNDLGKLCKTKSIKASPLFEVEEYPTLWQMTSTITGKLNTPSNISQMTRALFPSGSVTGAPKIRAMQVIAECEKESRGIYTGAIGYISPKNKTVFNIPIRTAVIDNVSGKASFGIGSGLVNDSRLLSEYTECLGKARFLTSASLNFHLIETMLYANGVAFLNEHLSRMHFSASYFGIPFSKTRAKQILSKLKLNKNNKYKIRLLLFMNGTFKTEVNTLDTNQPQKTKIIISKIKTDSKDIFLQHKTNFRSVYNAEYKKAVKKGLADYIFTNEKGEITEGCITNIFIKKNGRFYTPPLSSGLLNGIYRKALLKTNPKLYKEKIISLKVIKAAEEIYLCNSVKGLFRVYL